MPTPSAIDLVERSEAMIPALVARAASDEQRGMVSRETVEEIVRHGLLRAPQPARYAGLEMPFDVMTRIIVNLARGEHSVGWVYSLYALHNHHLALFDDRAQRDVWGSNPDAIIASSYSPYGKATSAPGGFALTGSWPFCSGCDHGDWFFVGGLVDGDPSDFRTFLVPREAVEIVDDWDVFGLKATGSKTIRIEALVPDYRTTPFGPNTESYRFPGLEVNTAPRFRAPYLVVFNRGVTAVSIGSLHALIDAFVAYSRAKVSMITGSVVAEMPDTVEAVGRAVALVEQLKILATHDLGVLERAGADGGGINPEAANVLRFRAQVVGDECLKAAQAIYELAGGGGLYERQPIARIYRNLIGARNHPATAVFRDTARQIGAAAYAAGGHEA